MSGKRDKAVRRQVDKHSVALFVKTFNAICDKPLGERTLSNPRFKHGIQNIVPAWNHDYTAQAKEAAQCQQ